jgi:HEPN domain-containing protein
VTELEEWVRKAEDDYRGAADLNRRRVEPVPGLVCYLCQQCAEKYLKAYLVSAGAVPPRIHGLGDLLDACAQYSAALEKLRADAVSLTQYGVNVRYPGMHASVEDGWEAMAAMRAIRRAVRRALGL